MGQTAHFLRDSSVSRDPAIPGRYTTTLSADWNAPFIPQGGYVTATALRAMAEELDAADQRLRSVTTVFAAQVRAEDLEVDVTVLRRGRSMSQLLGTARNVGNEAGHTSLAVFGGVRDGFEFTELRMPEVPPPAECPAFNEDVPEGFERRPMTLWDNVEGRAALGHAPWDDYRPTGSERAYWARFHEPPMLDDGRHDPYALVALCDTMPGAVGERLGPGYPQWVPPSADFTCHVFADTTSEWVLAHNAARHAGDGYASVDCALWDQSGTLLMYATQMMFFTFPDGPPPPDGRRAPPY